MADRPAYVLADRELSWLSFNERVLQEAEDATVPVGDRLDFLAIVSSNLDEFFRVRVASLRALLRLGKKKKAGLEFEPRALLAEIHARVDRQQQRFGRVLREEILPALRAHGIVLTDERGLDETDSAWLRDRFETQVRPHLALWRLDGDGPAPFLENRGLYLVVELRDAGGPRLAEEQADVAIVTIPSSLPRFTALPVRNDVRSVLFLDDIVRLHLGELFPGRTVAGAWSVKLTRDAELYLEDEFSVDLVDTIRRALGRRAAGAPSRFLHDPDLPPTILARIRDRLELEPEDVIAGGRYHNLHDLFAFPRFDIPGLASPPLEPIRPPASDRSVFDEMRERDRLVHFPYESYDRVLRLLDAAADDDYVESIHITLYRVAKGSAVVDALERACRKGRSVTVFVEVKARFDEETNLACAARLEAAGARVVYSMPGLKVHAKLLLIRRREDGATHDYAWLGTGNFNERTARVYADHGLLTADARLTRDVRRVFDHLCDDAKPEFEHLLVAPFTLRKALRKLVRREAAAAQDGHASGITLKLNSLEDPAAVGWLYDAAAAGVPVRLIVRGICRLVPPTDGSLEARSIVDRFLEHARIYRFHANGEDRMYLSSADWMTRNLDRRIEVAFPVLDPELRAELATFLDVQLADNVKARRIDEAMSNAYVRNGGPPVRSQMEMMERLKNR